MSSTIPPLLCSTPPPIDFDDGGGENEPDDFEPYGSVEGVYGQFEGPSEPNTPKHAKTAEKNELDLPIPSFIPFPTNIPIDPEKKESTDHIKTQDKNEEYKNRGSEETIGNSLENKIHIEPNEKSIPTKDTIGFILSEPPPIDVGYGSESQSPKNSRGDSPLSIEFSPGNLSDDDASIDFQINESRYDDNTSLPSLKFDAINISKSATPVSEEKPVTNKSPAFDELSLIDKDENQSAFDSTISIKSLDADKESRFVVDNNVMEEVSRTKLEKDGETLWTEPKYDDLKKSEITFNAEILMDNVQHIPSGESDIPNTKQNETKSLDGSPLCVQQISNENQHESSLDEDFSDDFQSFVSSEKVEVDSSNEVVKESNLECNYDEISFEADFSQVDFPPVIPSFPNPTAEERKLMTSIPSNSIDENVDDDFEDFQDFKSVALCESDDKSLENKSQMIENDEKCTSENDKVDEFNDDDFGDFGDFKEANMETTLPAEHPKDVDLPKIYEKLKSVLLVMFPVKEHIEDEAKEGESILPERLEKRLSLGLQEIDSAKALEYQWLQSNIKNSLVKSLGIDSRNILYGEKWNSSMPKFAANLGFSPLEPLKPSKLPLQPSKPNSSVSMEKSVISNNGASDVPAVKFDWNTSGLVNPLDGVKEILHEGKNKTIHSTRPHDSNGSNELTATDESTATNSQAPIDFIASLSSIDNDLKEANEVVEEVLSNTTHTNFISHENYTKPPTMPTTSKFIPLKETHIFTPSKSDCTISRSVTKANEKGPIDFDYEIAAAGIVINEQVVNKEYRDVVYNPEAQIRASEALVSEVDYDESRSKKEQINPIVDPNKNFRNKSIAPDLLSGTILNIMEKKVGRDFDDEFSDFQQNILPPPSTSQPSEMMEATSTTSNKINSPAEKKIVENQSKMENIDDEFTDFQSVAPPIDTSQLKAAPEAKPKSRTGTPALNDEMILSPAVLLPQAVKLVCSEPKINWPGNSDIDPEELARLEQLFPQANQVATQSFVQNVAPPASKAQYPANKEQKDDDDWSDFVSVPPNVNSGNQTQQEPAAVPTPTKLSTISKTYDDDDWSDFVSSAPASVSQSTVKPWSVPPLPPPQFSSWNQPSTLNSLPTISTSLGGYPPNASKTSHRHSSQQDYNRPVPTMLGKSTNVYGSNKQFLINGHYNQVGVNHSHPQSNQHEMRTLHHLQYHQQHQAYAKQNLPQFQHQQLQKQQRTTMISNANINVLKSQLNLAPSISLIPDLSFAAPKPLVNLSRKNMSNKK